LSSAERAANQGIGFGGFAIRFAAALALVYATYNPWGVSFVAWVTGTWTPAHESSWFASPALKFVVGVVLAFATYAAGAGWAAVLGARPAPDR